MDEQLVNTGQESKGSDRSKEYYIMLEFFCFVI